MSLLKKHLEIRKSQLPVSGMGVYTKVDIKKGQRICELVGRNITDEQYASLEGNRGQYCFYVDDKKIIDLYSFWAEPGRYINDAMGHVRMRGVKNNCYFDVIKRRVYVIAARDIKAGSELFVSYGRAYWDEFASKQAKIAA